MPFKHLHPLPLLIPNLYEIGKIIAYANEEEKAKGAYKLISQGRLSTHRGPRSSHTGIPTVSPNLDRLPHTIFPSEMPLSSLLISMLFILQDVPEIRYHLRLSHAICLLTHSATGSPLTILYYSLCLCMSVLLH